MIFFILTLIFFSCLPSYALQKKDIQFISHYSSKKHINEEQFVVYFRTNSWRLTNESRKTIQKAASFILERSATRVQIVGHTDQLGNPEYNLKLSRRRTETVLSELQKKGISTSIMNADWNGEFDPALEVGENDSEPMNRRVVITVFQ